VTSVEACKRTRTRTTASRSRVRGLVTRSSRARVLREYLADLLRRPVDERPDRGAFPQGVVGSRTSSSRSRRFPGQQLAYAICRSRHSIGIVGHGQDCPCRHLRKTAGRERTTGEARVHMDAAPKRLRVGQRRHPDGRMSSETSVPLARRRHRPSVGLGSRTTAAPSSVGAPSRGWCGRAGS